VQKFTVLTLYYISKKQIELKLVRQVIPLILLTITSNVGAQMYIGITCDLGNRVKIYPNPDALLKRPMTLSGSLIFYKREEIRNDWHLQYGAALGVLGYKIKAREIDTLSNDPDFYDPYSSYYTLYISGHFAFGKQFIIRTKNISVFLGGGITHYFDFLDIQANSSSSVWDGNSFEKVFEYEMSLANEKLKGFAEVSIQTKLNRRILMGLQYRYHFKPAVSGTYNFYHTEIPSNGTLSVTQRAISILFLIRIGKKL
jgi:hypothetical protein